jgi:hypothetical protein
MRGLKSHINNIMKKIIIGLTLLVGLLLLAIYAPKQTETQQLGGISRTVTNATSSVTTSTAVQVLSEDTRANYRRVQNDTNSTVYCIEGATSTAVLSKGIRLIQGEDYVWSADKHNLYPGKISCIANTTTSVILTQQSYE